MVTDGELLVRAARQLKLGWVGGMRATSDGEGMYQGTPAGYCKMFTGV